MTLSSVEKSVKSRLYRKINAYKRLALLGVGTQGKVYLCIHSDTKIKYALKTIKKRKIKSFNQG